MTLAYPLTPGTYRTRDGRIATVSRVSTKGLYTIKGRVSGLEQTWMPSGSVLNGCAGEPLDLVERADDTPPDPEGMNADRAEWAATALHAFQAVTGTDDEVALGDLLCNLMHLADRENYDFDAALERARMHYEAETGGEGV